MYAQNQSPIKSSLQQLLFSNHDKEADYILRWKSGDILGCRQGFVEPLVGAVLGVNQKHDFQHVH